MAKKVNIPEKVRIQVWTEAAGRCQFNNCSKPLWYNELTLNKRNFSEMAHIIGGSSNGPRGNEKSEELAKDPNNIMLMCDRCHKEIDDTVLRELYPEKVLKTMKKDHSDRVRMLLDQPSKKTRPLILTSNIGNQATMFGDRSIQSAILPDYPDRISDDWFKIEIGTFNRTSFSAWKTAIAKIDESIDSVERACLNGKIEHLSIFGLAPQPLLMWLGRQLGDKVPTQVFEPRRTDNLDKKWSWDITTEASIEYKISKIKEGRTNDVILLLSLSDYLSRDKYPNMLENDTHVYQLTIDEPVQGFLKSKSDKSLFIHSCRSLLNIIQKEIGNNCIIHVLPAMPASLAIEFGRLIQPTKDPEIWVYENIRGEKPEKIIQLQ
ncbi:MAG: SAVED domain-containing protein [bacterium]|nr:SAVED domain-containing protein [bacterium]